MNRSRLVKRFKWPLLFLGLVILFQFTTGCFSFRMSASEVETYFKDRDKAPKLEKYKVDDREIHYAAIGSDSLPTVYFFHGAPGSWSAFIDFMKNDALLQHVRLIAVDRPGYGYSNFGNSVVSLKKQAQMFKPLLKKHTNGKPQILVGHSLGGPIIGQMALDYPELIDALIMVAPSIDPSLEPEEDWFRYPLQTPFLSWLLPTSFQVTNEEIYALEHQLQQLAPQWEKIDQPVTVIQGGKDLLVDPANAAFVEEKFKNAPVDIVFKPELNHFIPWKQPRLIEQAILKYALSK
ncbi:MAG: alpha/beta hydrolase [Fulvivirga sp.]|nr:alpha/beta hydrolase [Fulvivirga sp.]